MCAGGRLWEDVDVTVRGEYTAIILHSVWTVTPKLMGRTEVRIN